MPQRKFEHWYVVVRVLGHDADGVSVSVADAPGGVPPEHNLGAFNTPADARDANGILLRDIDPGQLTTIDQDLIY